MFGGYVEFVTLKSSKFSQEVDVLILTICTFLG